MSNKNGEIANNFTVFSSAIHPVQLEIITFPTLEMDYLLRTCARYIGFRSWMRYRLPYPRAVVHAGLRDLLLRGEQR